MSKELFHNQREQQNEEVTLQHRRRILENCEPIGGWGTVTYVMKDKSANIVAIKAEKKRLDALEKSEQSIIDRLKESIHVAMDLYGITEIKTETLKLNFRRSEGVVGSNDYLTDDLVTIVPEQRKPNLVAIKAAIKEGIEIEGYSIEERFSLQIK
jgi:hypothetical protein